MDLFDEAACRALGVGRSDLRALNLLEHGPLQAAALAEALGLTRAAVTTLVDRLAAAGYVTRTPAPRDRRAVLIGLQPATYRAFARAYRPLGEQVWSAVADLSNTDRELVIQVLATMAHTFDHARTHLQAGA